MAHHAKHARTSEAKSATRSRLPLLGLAAVGLGVVAAPAAHAGVTSAADVAAASDAASATAAAQNIAAQEVGGVRLYPLAGTPIDLLSNNLHVPVGGMDLSTFPVTAPLHDGLPLREVPVVGSLIPATSP